LNAGVDVTTANTVRRLVFHTTSTGATTRRTIESSKGIYYIRGRDDCHYPNKKSVSAVRDVNVLIIIGVRGGSVNRELAQVAADGSADGIKLNTFESLADLPRYSETFEDRGTPSSVGALRTAAEEADAVLIVTTYHGRVPAVVHNAIDWLTRRWDQATLHDKPLAVIGRAAGCYSGVWSHQTEEADRIAGPRVIESITVSNLGEAIRKLAREAHVDAEPSSASSA
jgi:NAD(P)H-dependent FMN reductase